MSLKFEYITENERITFSEDSAFWITGISGLSSNEINITETQGVGQIGSTRSTEAVLPKDLTISGLLLEPLNLNRKQLLSCVSPSVMAKFVITDGDESWYVEGTPKRTPVMEETPVQQNFQFIFHAPYPYWRSMEENHTLLAGTKPFFSFPLNTGGTWYISQYENSLMKYIFNNGDVATGITVILKANAKVKLPEILHVETGTFLRITKPTLEKGEGFEICTVYGQKRVLHHRADGFTENGFKYISPDSNMNMQLLPKLNTFRYSAAENREGLQIIVSAPKGVCAGV